MWVATRRQLIRRGSVHIYVNAGDPVPEAAEWSPIWRDSEKYVKWVDDEPKPVVENIRAVAKPVVEPAPLPEPVETKPEEPVEESPAEGPKEKKKRQAPKRKAPKRKKPK